MRYSVRECQYHPGHGEIYKDEHLFYCFPSMEIAKVVQAELIEACKSGEKDR